MGRSQADVAEALGVDRTALTRIERGERGLSTLELILLSEYLDLPVSYFLERATEAVTSLRGSVSDDPGVSERERFRADTILDSRVRSADFLRAEGVLPRAIRHVSNSVIHSREDALRLAGEARDLLDISGPVPAIHAVCEMFGFYVFVERIGIDGASRSPDSDFGVAIIRDAADPGRRRATAAHELGHHLAGDAYVADFGATGGGRSDHEQLIDTFAAQFLLPADELRTRMQDVASEELWERLVSVAAEYRVSWTLATRVACDAGIIDAPTQRRFYGRVPLRADLLRITGQTVTEDLSLRTYGPSWTRAVMQAQSQDLITRARAEELLEGADPFGAQAPANSE